MTRHLSIISALSLMVCISCNNQPAVYDVNSFLPVAEEQVDQEVILRGEIKHVCRHGGKRCFISASDSDQTVRIEAKGDIHAFTQEQIGKEIVVKGFVREQRIENESIVEKEKALEAQKMEAEGEEAQHHCTTEQNSIDKMRQWMKKHDKDYYAVYYLEGIQLIR